MAMHLNHVLLFFVLLFQPALSATETGNSSVVNSTWFWVFMSLGFVVIICAPSTMIIACVICKRKQNSQGSIETDSSGDTSSTFTQVQGRLYTHRLPRRYQSHFVEGCPTPPPPYTSDGHPRRLFVTPSRPPSYTSQSSETDIVQTISNGAVTIIYVDESEQFENVQPPNVMETPLNHSFISNDSSEYTSYL